MGYQYDLVKHTEEFICRNRFSGHSGVHLYPSEASVKAKDEFGDDIVYGTCMRSAFFRCVGEEGKPYGPRTQMIFRLGKSVEDMILAEWRMMGIFVASGVRFENRDYHIHGELDAVLREPATDIFFGAEVKSYYGYQAGVEIMGNKSVTPYPKMNNLLQALIYTKEFLDRLAYFKLFYIERGDGERQQFDVRAVPDELENGTIVYRPEVNGVVRTDFTIDDIYGRYAELMEHIKKSTVPPREFELYYEDKRIEDDFEKGKLSKSKYEKFKKKGDSERPGDWNCSYCNYKDLCWK